MSESMVERMAQAIYEEAPFFGDNSEFLTWEQANAVRIHYPDKCRRQARAVLGAMREPTYGMTNAGEEDIENWDRKTDAAWKVSWNVWVAKIDAALEGA